MIPRYSLPEMSAVWSEEHRLDVMLRVEIFAMEAMAKLDVVLEDDYKACLRKFNGHEKARKSKRPKHSDLLFTLDRVNELDEALRHDVIAFLTNVSEKIGEPARHLHFGLTSSDVLDTALAVQLREAANLMLKAFDRLLAALKSLALKHKYTFCVGRSHGMHADLTTFGLKIASHYAEIERGRLLIETARDHVSFCAVSGAVGTFAHVHPSVEEHVADKLGLKPEPVSSQIIPRDRHAAFFCRAAIVASSLERLALEVRHLQRNEVGEAAEGFAPGQKGSSAMPHKRNPILSENICGLARIIRASAIPALENIPLWHERDMSHSSVERVIAPDVCLALHFILHRAADVMENLVVHPDAMQRNLRRTNGVVHTQGALLALIQHGLSREEAYAVIQKHALVALDEGKDFIELVVPDLPLKDNTPLNPKDALEAKTALQSALEQRVRDGADYIFHRVFGKLALGGLLGGLDPLTISHGAVGAVSQIIWRKALRDGGTCPPSHSPL